MIALNGMYHHDQMYKSHYEGVDWPYGLGVPVDSEQVGDPRVCFGLPDNTCIHRRDGSSNLFTNLIIRIVEHNSTGRRRCTLAHFLLDISEGHDTWGRRA